MGNFSKNPDDVLAEAISKGYASVLMQQGVPVLDRDLNLLADLAHHWIQAINKGCLGNGVPLGSDGFNIGAIQDNDFPISAGTILANGFFITVGEGQSYRNQPIIDSLVPNLSDRMYYIYIHVWQQEIGADDDLKLNNDDDVGICTSVRRKVFWQVVASENQINAEDHVLLAVISDNTVSDKRIKLSLQSLAEAINVKDGKVGIGTTSPTQKLEISNGQLAITRGDLRFTQEAAPGRPTVAINNTAGNLNGRYTYKITFVTALGETQGGTISSEVSPDNQQVDLTNIPTGTSGVVNARRIYRKKSSDPQHKLVTAISDNTTTSYTDNKADTALGVDIPTSNTTAAGIWVDVTKRMQIDQNGNVGIGTTAPKNKLDVEGKAVIGRSYSGSVSAPNDGLLVEGNIGIGTTSPQKKLDVSGDVVLADRNYLGSEKVTNGAFDDDSRWTWGIGWTHDPTNKQAKHSPDNTTALEQDVSAIDGKIYFLSFEVKERTAGNISSEVGGTTGISVSANGISTQTILSSGTGKLKFKPSSDFDGAIDNVTLKEIIGGNLTVIGNVGIGTANPSGKRLAIIDSNTANSAALSAEIIDGSGHKVGVRATAHGSDGTKWGVYGSASGDGDSKIGVQGQASSEDDTDKYGLCGHAWGSNGSKYGVDGTASGDGGTKYGVKGNASSNDTTTKFGLHGTASGNDGPKIGVFGHATGNGYEKQGVKGYASSDDTTTKIGLSGSADGGNGDKFGVHGHAEGAGGTKYGVEGFAISNDNTIKYGLYGSAGGEGGMKYGVCGKATGSGINYAGYFDGNVEITGRLTKSSGGFLIDHPLDPLNKTLQHNFVESPESLCLYRGKVQLDANGKATVKMPEYFAALTKEDEATVNLTPIGKIPFPISYEWSKKFTAFTIFGAPDAEVAYLVLADRDDPVIHQLARPVEEEKVEHEKGKLFYPEAFGHPATMGIHAEIISKLEAERVAMSAAPKPELIRPAIVEPPSPEIPEITEPKKT